MGPDGDACGSGEGDGVVGEAGATQLFPGSAPADADRGPVEDGLAVAPSVDGGAIEVFNGSPWAPWLRQAHRQAAKRAVKKGMFLAAGDAGRRLLFRPGQADILRSTTFAFPLMPYLVKTKYSASRPFCMLVVSHGLGKGK